MSRDNIHCCTCLRVHLRNVRRCAPPTCLSMHSLLQGTDQRPGPYTFLHSHTSKSQIHELLMPRIRREIIIVSKIGHQHEVKKTLNAIVMNFDGNHRCNKTDMAKWTRDSYEPFSRYKTGNKMADDEHCPSKKRDLHHDIDIIIWPNVAHVNPDKHIFILSGNLFKSEGNKAQKLLPNLDCHFDISGKGCRTNKRKYWPAVGEIYYSTSCKLNSDIHFLMKIHIATNKTSK